jgi:hypothetical protein
VGPPGLNEFRNPIDEFGLLPALPAVNGFCAANAGDPMLGNAISRSLSCKKCNYTHKGTWFKGSTIKYINLKKIKTDQLAEIDRFCHSNQKYLHSRSNEILRFEQTGKAFGTDEIGC